MTVFYRHFLQGRISPNITYLNIYFILGICTTRTVSNNILTFNATRPWNQYISLTILSAEEILSLPFLDFHCDSVVKNSIKYVDVSTCLMDSNIPSFVYNMCSEFFQLRKRIGYTTVFSSKVETKVRIVIRFAIL